VSTQQAATDKAYELQGNIVQQQVVAEQIRIERVQREEQTKVQEAEIKRKELELVATIQKPAEAERQRVEILAEAQRSRRAVEADGEAQAIRAQGSAEADVVRQKGDAEADAMHAKAGAFAEYTQAAVLDKMLAGLPELARAMSGSLSNVDRITIISDGHNGAASQITGEVSRMVAQVPALLETITGMSIPEMLKRLQEIQAPQPERAVAPPDGDAGRAD
jgi:flotillin